MKPSKPVDFTYMGHLYNMYCSDKMADEQLALGLLQQIKKAANLHVPSIPIFFVIDYTKQNYLVMSDSVKIAIGFDPRDFLEGGLQFLVQDVFQKDDFKVFSEKIFSVNSIFLKTIAINERDQYVFRYNYRIKNKKGKTKHVLQETSYITSKETGLPVYSLGTVTDITDYKNDNLIIHKIDKVTTDNGNLIKQPIVKNYFYPGEENIIVSRQEKNILGYMADGLSSKMIADKLHISENTISNHRQNMLRKTNTKNVAQLVAFVIRSHII
jgi:DNA-binding CsgD family transcriptional regulator